MSTDGDESTDANKTESVSFAHRTRRRDSDASTPPHERVAARLRAADLDSEHFIDVHDGAKASYDHTQRGSEDLDGNYGTYATGDEPGGLVIVDVDGYRDDVDADALAAVRDLPATLTVTSPHTDGEVDGHRYYRVVPGEGFETAQDALHAVTGNEWSTNLSCGELKVGNGYVVGPGSQLDKGGCRVPWCDDCDGCDKDWCDDCANPDGGWYEIAHDRPIATITADEFADFLRADPKVASGGGRDTDDGTATGTGGLDDRDNPEPPTRMQAETTEDADAAHPDPAAVIAVTGVAENYPRGPAGEWAEDDRSRHDYAICKEFARHGVPKDAAERWFRDHLPQSKVVARDSIDYGGATVGTWASAVEEVRAETDGEPTLGKALDGAGDGYDPDAPDATDIEVVVTRDDHDGTRYHGPPEPVVRDDGTLAVVRPTSDHSEVRAVALGTWRCQNCGMTTTSPVRAGTSARDLSPPEECPQCDGPAFAHVGVDREDIQTALQADQTWYPPSGVDPDGYATLWGDVRAFIYDHWGAGADDIDDAVYAGLTSFALSTWVRPNLTFVPHLMTIGRTTGGKTRLLNSTARVSYRGLVTGSATPASMFRLIDRYDVSYYISEYHGLPRDTQGLVDNVLRSGQKEGEVITRAEPTSDGYEPKVFDPFTHVAVATQYDLADDIKNRCIQTRSSGTDREMPAVIDEDRATALRNRLLYARFRLLHSDDLGGGEDVHTDEWDVAEDDAFAYLRKRGIDGRTREKLLSLVTAAIVWDRLDDDFEAFVDLVVDQDRDAAADSEDALFAEVVRDLAFDTVGDVYLLGNGDPFAAVDLPYSDIADRYEAMTGVEKSPSWVGHAVKRHGFEKARKADGTVISDTDLRPKLQELCDEFGLDWERSDVHDPAPELPDDETGKGAAGCSECGRNRILTHRNAASGGRICTDCADDVRVAHEADGA